MIKEVCLLHTIAKAPRHTTKSDIIWLAYILTGSTTQFKHERTHLMGVFDTLMYNGYVQKTKLGQFTLTDDGVTAHNQMLDTMRTVSSKLTTLI